LDKIELAEVTMALDRHAESISDVVSLGTTSAAAVT